MTRPFHVVLSVALACTVFPCVVGLGLSLSSAHAAPAPVRDNAAMSHVGIVVQDAASKKDSSRASAGQKIRLLVSWDVARVTGKPAEKVTWAIIYGGRIVKSDFVADTAQAGAWSWGRRWVVAKDWARGRYTAVGIVVVANHATRVTRAFTVVK